MQRLVAFDKGKPYRAVFWGHMEVPYVGELGERLRASKQIACRGAAHAARDVCVGREVFS